MSYWQREHTFARAIHLYDAAHQRVAVVERGGALTVDDIADSANFAYFRDLAEFDRYLEALQELRAHITAYLAEGDNKP